MFQKGRIYSVFLGFYDIMKNEKIESDNERGLLTDLSDFPPSL